VAVFRQWVGGRIEKMTAVFALSRSPAALAGCFGGAVFVQATIVVFYFIVAHALSLDMTFWDLAVIVPMSFVVQMLPLSVNCSASGSDLRVLLHTHRPAAGARPAGLLVPTALISCSAHRRGGLRQPAAVKKFGIRNWEFNTATSETRSRVSASTCSGTRCPGTQEAAVRRAGRLEKRDESVRRPDRDGVSSSSALVTPVRHAVFDCHGDARDLFRLPIANRGFAAGRHGHAVGSRTVESRSSSLVVAFVTNRSFPRRRPARAGSRPPATSLHPEPLAFRINALSSGNSHHGRHPPKASRPIRLAATGDR
jgi:hypothetical protein